MVRRWILYLLAVVLCMVFYFAYLQWFAWLLLVGVLCLPLAGLLVSLPAMLTLQVAASCALPVGLGEEEPASLRVDCKLPAPPVRGRIRVTRTNTGEKWKLKPGRNLPSDHCGELVCQPVQIKVYDYLGLFFVPTQRKIALSVPILPKAEPIRHLPDIERILAQSWVPKPGGGYAENHELRLYRPGDSLNQIHWKMSAKTGKYIIREAMIPKNSRIILTMELKGTAGQQDTKFGQLVWLSQYLLEKELRHEWSVLTGNGLRSFPVADEASLMVALNQLLAEPPAMDDATWPSLNAGWHYRIGGEQDEA
ncbi:MAG: DUF58 domain-containing protein [Oscillospiraceae bacterium]|nr:DUF58 domain-containing protein [Oscillospiraceae bacterium]